MKFEIELQGKFEADINFWSGKAKLSYEGMELKEEERNTFLLGNEKVSIGGTLFSGVYLIRGEEKVQIVKLYWYDYVAGIIPFVVSLIGGAIGAVLGAIGFFICYKTMPYVRVYILRLLICIGVAAAIFGIILLLALLLPSIFI